MGDPYDIEPIALGPELPGVVVLRPRLDEVIDAIAADLFMQALACSRAFGDFHFAIDCDSQSEAVLRRLMYDPPLREFPWIKTQVWLVAEDHDDPGHPASRASIVRAWLASHCDIPPAQIHSIPTDDPAPADAYERDLQAALEWREKGHDRLDFALLSLDPDGAILPDAIASTSPGGLVDQHADRCAMSARLLNAARCVGIIATGADRAPAVGRWAGRSASAPACPIDPVGGELRWYLDHDADPARPGA